MSKDNKRIRIDSELVRLRRELASGQRRVRQVESKASIEIEKSKIRRQLLLLKHPRAISLAKRFGRTGKTIGKALLKQGRLIAAQQERDRRLENAREKMLSRPVKIRKSKKGGKRKSTDGGFKFMAPLDLTRLDF